MHSYSGAVFGEHLQETEPEVVDGIQICLRYWISIDLL